MQAKSLAVATFIGILATACLRDDASPARDPGEPLPGLAAADVQRFTEGHVLFNKSFTADEGLGPLFNQDRCSSCHDLPVVGGTGVEIVSKATRFTPPNVCDFLIEEGGDNVQERSTPALQALGINRELTPPSATGRSIVSPPSLFGLGLVELIPEADIVGLEDVDDTDGDGISGRAPRLPDGRLGRFGRKSDIATLDEFVETALRFEMGLTTYLNPEEETLNGTPVPPHTDPAADPEIDARTLTLLADYVRFLAPPARFTTAADTVEQGEAIFNDIGCAACHVARMRTARSEHPAFDRKTIELYSDMLLHDMGAESAGVCGIAASPTEYRTARLMGLRFRTQYLHDGSAGSIAEAILRHGGEGESAARGFERLNELGRNYLIRFLGSL
jgi:CxxC motif-containing protein (DUF1111 family)